MSKRVEAIVASAGEDGVLVLAMEGEDPGPLPDITLNVIGLRVVILEWDDEAQEGRNDSRPLTTAEWKWVMSDFEGAWPRPLQLPEKCGKPVKYGALDFPCVKKPLHRGMCSANNLALRADGEG